MTGREHLSAPVGASSAAQTVRFWSSTIGRKAVMAVTGIVLILFVLGHLAGNLQVYLPNGREAMNAYARFLREFLHGAGLWIARIGLLVAVLLHIWAAVSLTRDSRKARPVGYREKAWVESTYASRTMRCSGFLVFFFVVYHLMHFTFGNAHPNFIPGDVYQNFIVGFRSVPVSIAYVIAMVALGFHLRHGVWSMLQTLGLSHPRYQRLARVAAAVFAVVVTIGNLSFPVAVQAGWVR